MRLSVEAQDRQLEELYAVEHVRQLKWQGRHCISIVSVIE